jgi:hypothetical protein
MAVKKSQVPSKALLVSVVITLVLLTVQGFTGDSINLFAVFPEPVTDTFTGFYQALLQAGGLTAFHAIEGLAIVLGAISIVVSAFRQRTTKVVRAFAVFGTTAVISAAIGGILFVLSGFKNDPNSAQMGGSYISAYASYFLLLYFLKQPTETIK